MSNADTIQADPSTGEVVSAELVEVSNDESISQAIEALKSGHNTGLVHSFVGDDEDTIDQVLAALSDTTPIDDVIGKPIAMVNYIVQKVRIKNDDNTVSVAPRIVIIDADDAAYHVTSPIVLRDLMTYLGMRGEPSTWKTPLTLRFEKGGTGNRRFITANVVRAAKTAPKK